jgi:hypothetical protein
MFMRVLPRHLYICAVAVAATVLINACASSPAIRRETNPGVTFGSYKTFGFLSPLATDKFSYESLLTQHLKDAVRRTMDSKGYIFSDGMPDLLLNFHVNIQDAQYVRNVPRSATYAGYAGGYYGYRTGYYVILNRATVETVNYKQGTLTIDLIDANQKVLAWTATAEDRVPDAALKDPGRAIDSLVSNMMAPLTAAVR